MHKAAASCKDIFQAPVTDWELHGVTLGGYCYAVRHGMQVQLITLYRVSHLQCYGITAHGNVTGVYVVLEVSVRKMKALTVKIWRQ
jgi:phage protein U